MLLLVFRTLLCEKGTQPAVYLLRGRLLQKVQSRSEHKLVKRRRELVSRCRLQGISKGTNKTYRVVSAW